MANSNIASETAVPSMAKDVSFTDVKISGSNMGKDRTGYNVPFDPALAIIAAIKVDEIAIPILPKINVMIKSR